MNIRPIEKRHVELVKMSARAELFVFSPSVVNLATVTNSHTDWL